MYRLFALFTCAALYTPLYGADIRIGIIGTDTSHAGVFTKFFNDPSSPGHVPGFRVVAAYKGGSPDIPSSANRVEKFAEDLRAKYKIEIVPDIKTLLSKVDAVLLESVDGRKHLAQAKEVFAAKKPVFIDKPLASTLDDAREIARLAKQSGTPWFTASSLRFDRIGTEMKFPDSTGAIAWGPADLEEHHQLDLSWYGIHATEILYAMMGPGCEEVTRMHTADTDEVTCRWKDGRIGTLRGLRKGHNYGAVNFREKTFVLSPADYKSSYVPLLSEIAKFFQTGKAPVPEAEMLEIFAFLDASQRSKEAGGKPMRLR